jgi:hypothetical protein
MADGLFDLARRILRPRHRPQRITLIRGDLPEADARWLVDQLAIRAVEYRPGAWAVIAGTPEDLDGAEQQCRDDVAAVADAAAGKAGAA